MLIFSVLILGPFVFVGFGTVVMLLGVLWSPVAALLCARAARRRGFHPRYFAMLGAVYSILMIVPWVLLLQRLRGKLVPRGLLKLSYWGLYVGIWGCGMITFYFNLGSVLLLAYASQSAMYPEGSMYGPVVLPIEDLIFVALMLVANVSALAVSARALVKRWRADHVSGSGLLAQDSHELPRGYVMPFAHAMAATAVSIAVTVTVTSMLDA